MSFFKVKKYSRHIDSSEKTTRGHLSAGMPHVRLPSGRILIPVEQADEWLMQFLVKDEDQKIVDNILDGLNG